MLNIAMVGTGYMARKHSQALVAEPGVRLHTVCSTPRSRAAAQQFCQDYGYASSTTSWQEVLQDPDVHGVWICIPDSHHARYAIDALLVGKHVFCEKPLARTQDEFQQIRIALAESPGVLQVGMNCRYREQYSITKDLVASGDLGELRFLRGTYLHNSVRAAVERQKPWWLDCPEGEFFFLHGGGIHCIDLLQWIGGEILSVFARATGYELGSDFKADTFSVSMEYASGAIGELLVSASAFQPRDISLQLWLSEGSIVGERIYRRQGVDLADRTDTVQVEQKTIDLGLQFQEWSECLRTGAKPMNCLEEAYENFRIIRAIEDSLSRGQPISLSG